MISLVQYINESVKNTDLNKIVKKLCELFVNNEEVLIKKGSKLDLSSNYNITVPADYIDELREILSHKYPFSAETHYTGYSGTSTDGILVSYTAGFKSEDPAVNKLIEKINKARLKKLSASVRKQIDKLLIGTLSTHMTVDVNISATQTENYVSCNDWYISVSKDMATPVLYYIKNVLGLYVNVKKNLNDKIKSMVVSSMYCKDSTHNIKDISPIEQKIQKEAIKQVSSTVKTKFKNWIYTTIGKSSSNKAVISCSNNEFNINSYGQCNCPYKLAIGITQYAMVELKFKFRIELDRYNSAKTIYIYK